MSPCGGRARQSGAREEDGTQEGSGGSGSDAQRGVDHGSPSPGPKPKDQDHFTDTESRIVKAGNGDHFAQAYPAQAAVAVENRLILGQWVTDAPKHKEPAVLAILDPLVGPGIQETRVLRDKRSRLSPCRKPPNSR